MIEWLGDALEALLTFSDGLLPGGEKRNNTRKA